MKFPRCLITMAHLTRYYMYKRIMECLKIKDLFPIRGKILGISGIKHFHQFMDHKHVELIDTEYPNVDMRDLPYQNNLFDFVISDQVIEHLEEPNRAIAESYRVLNKGGIAIHSTCFINYLHPSPKDFWRFSPDALRFLCKDFSEILCDGGWGNRFAILLCFLSDRFRFSIITESKWSVKRAIANYNEMEYPIVTWIIAKK